MILNQLALFLLWELVSIFDMAAVDIPEFAKVYLDKPYVKVFWNPDDQVLTSTWSGFFDYSEISAVGRRILEAVSFERATKVLYDARGIEMLDDSSQQYIAGYFTKQMVRSGVKKAAAVFPDDVFAKFSVDQIQDNMNRAVNVRFFKSTSEASQWLGN